MANDLLGRRLGVRVVRAGRFQALESRTKSATEASRGLEQRLRESETEVKRLREVEAEVKRLREGEAELKRLRAGQQRRGRLPSDYDADFTELWEFVRERTMTSHEKLYGLRAAVRYVVRNHIPGAVVECGVWRGGSMIAVASLLDTLETRDRDLYLFDTYEGMTEPTERDIQISTKKTAQERLATEDRTSLVWAVASLEDVQRGFEQVRYPGDRIHFVKGPVEETVPDQAPDQIAILRLDTDWYESTKHELQHLYERLVPGGVLIIDDYGTWQGSREATDEFLAETGDALLPLRSGTGRIMIKPGLPTASGQ